MYRCGYLDVKNNYRMCGQPAVRFSCLDDQRGGPVLIALCANHRDVYTGAIDKSCDVSEDEFTVYKIMES